MTLCRVNHSCFPNVVYISEKRQFRALRAIKTLAAAVLATNSEEGR